MPNRIIALFVIAGAIAVPIYFQQWIREAKRTLEDLDAKLARLTLCLYGCLFVFATLISDKRNAGLSTLGFGITVFSFCLIYSYRSREAAAAGDVKATSGKNFLQTLRQLSALIALFLTVGMINGLLAHWVGSLPATVASIGCFVYLAPVMVRMMWSANPMAESSLRREIETVFEHAGARVGRIYLISNENLKMANALVCGPKYGFGPFKRSLFITENLFSLLEKDELMAVISHEASHFKLHHVFKRMLWALVAFAASSAAIAIPYAFCTQMLPHSVFQVAMMNLIFVVPFVLQFNLIACVIHRQEHEADLGAVALGASPESLIRALEKLTAANRGSRRNTDPLTRYVMGKFHPSVDERESALKRGTFQSARPWIFQLRFAAGYAVFLVILGASSMLGKDFPFRTPASVPTGNTER